MVLNTPPKGCVRFITTYIFIVSSLHNLKVFFDVGFLRSGSCGGRQPDK